MQVSLCSFYDKAFRGFRDKKNWLSISKGLYIHFNPQQNASPILLHDALVMVTNEGLIAYISIIRGIRGIFTPISQISFMFKIYN